MRRALRFLLAGMLATIAAPSLAAAAPTIAVTATCAYDGGRLAVSGRGFEPGAPVTLEVMPTADPAAGAPLAEATATADAAGAFAEILDVPPTGATSSPRARSVRARSRAGAPILLAAAPLRIARRGVRVSGSRQRAADTLQRWRVTGLPEGTVLYAHFRRRGRTALTTRLGQAADPCGRLAFALRALPLALARRGTWQLWVTADRTFRRPTKGVYLHRRLTVTRSAAGARVRGGAIASRLVPFDVRFSAPATNGMAADASRIGLVDLTFVDARGATVEFLERIGDRLVRLGTARAGSDEVLTHLAEATTWSCERPERRFVATATRPDGELALGTFSLRTPSCAARFELTAPRRAEPGAVARVRVVDRWGIGAVTPTLCVTPPKARRTCERVALGRGVTVASRRFRATARGDWVVRLRIGERAVRKAVVSVGDGVPAAPAAPTVLATGDSTMQGIDGFLGDELGDSASVVSDVRIGTAISGSAQPSLPGADDEDAVQWLLLAEQQAARLRPRASVVSLGAAEGYTMLAAGGARLPCCDTAWKAEYSRRARLMMLAYARRGRGRVLWLTLPLPRDDRRLAITRAVNEAILAAAPQIAGVKVLRMDLVFTPDGYRDVIRYRGHDVDVRDADGVHLNVAGTAIAARIVARELGALAP